MAWTAIPTAVTGSVVTAAYGNIIKGDLDYHQAFLDGTGTGTIVTLTGCEVRMGKSVPSGDPGAIADTLSVFTNKSNGDHEVVFFNDNTSPTPGALEFAFWQRAYSTTAMTLGITNDGKLTGKGFYSSGEFSVASAGVGTVSHGLSARPRFVWGFHASATGTEDSKQTPLVGAGIASSVTLGTVSSTQISVSNGMGATRYVHVYAIL